MNINDDEELIDLKEKVSSMAVKFKEKQKENFDLTNQSIDQIFELMLNNPIHSFELPDLTYNQLLDRLNEKYQSVKIITTENVMISGKYIILFMVEDQTFRLENHYSQGSRLMLYKIKE